MHQLRRTLAVTALLALTSAILTLAAQGRPAGDQTKRQHTRLFPPADLGLLEGPDRDAW